MSKTSTEVAKASTTSLSADAIAILHQIESGYENVTARDLLIPRLTILQGLSPQVTQGKPEYDKEARVGEIYDVGLQQRFPDGIKFIPVYYCMQWLEWAPRASGKGLQNIHDSDAVLDVAEKDDKGKMVLPNGNYVSETAQLYGLNVTADFRKSFIPMASTQLKKSRRLLTLATGEKLQRPDGTYFVPPLFYRSYMMTTVPESNNEGSWMGWKIERAEALTDFQNWQELIVDIKQFRQSLATGLVRGDVSSLDDEAKHDPNAPM